MLACAFICGLECGEEALPGDYRSRVGSVRQSVKLRKLSVRYPSGKPILRFSYDICVPAYRDVAEEWKPLRGCEIVLI